MRPKTRHPKIMMVGGSRTIHPRPSNMFALEKINELNGDSLYRIRINGCFHYFYGCNKNYVLTIINEEYYLLKLDESHQDLDGNLIRRMEEFLPITTMRQKYALIAFLNDVDADILYFRHRECPPHVDLTNAKTALVQWNQLLQTKCPNARLALDYVYDLRPPANRLVSYRSDPSSLILCLYTERGCVSSIMITMEADMIMIDSATDPPFSGRKYNKLLRCTVVLLSLLLSPRLQRVTSHAIHPISAYVLLRYFDGIVSPVEENSDFFDWVNEKQITMDSTTDVRPLLDRYQQSCKQSGRCFELMVHIELTPDLLDKAERAFHQILEEVVC